MRVQSAGGEPERALRTLAEPFAMTWTPYVTVVSNHTDLEDLAHSYVVPFHHVPVTRSTKTGAKFRLLEFVESHDVELIVARPLQVLSDDVCRKMDGRIINIHDSFLPNFRDARQCTSAVRSHWPSDDSLLHRGHYDEQDREIQHSRGRRAGIPFHGKTLLFVAPEHDSWLSVPIQRARAPGEPAGVDSPTDEGAQS